MNGHVGFALDVCSVASGKQEQVIWGCLNSEIPEARKTRTSG